MMSRLDSVIPASDGGRAVTEPEWKIVALIPGAPTGDVSASASTDPDAPLDDKGARRTFIHYSRQRA